MRAWTGLGRSWSAWFFAAKLPKMKDTLVTCSRLQLIYRWHGAGFRLAFRWQRRDARKARLRAVVLPRFQGFLHCRTESWLGQFRAFQSVHPVRVSVLVRICCQGGRQSTLGHCHPHFRRPVDPIASTGSIRSWYASEISCRASYLLQASGR